MCEQTSLEYNNGDVVWVKLGPCWWPGEVKALSELPADVASALKKPPLATVKFFEEDSYEYVKNINHIYSYNCKKKNEFIKKGLDLYRAKNAFMDKFPQDICTAERMTGGDPNIISSAQFTPERKPNYAALIFGTPSPKKSTKDAGRSKGRPSLKFASSSYSEPSTSSDPIITHRRFLGDDDHEVRILVQAPERTEPEAENPRQMYTCPSCGLKSERIDVIVLHNKSHIQGVYKPVSTMKKTKRHVPKKTKKVIKMPHSNTASIDEDLALLEQGLPLTTDSTDDEDEAIREPQKAKRKQHVRHGAPSERKHAKVESKSATETKIDIQNDLLAEWEEDSVSDSQNLDEPGCSSAPSSSSVKIACETEKKIADKSCFDFDDEEDSNIICSTSAGRKIPRVIPEKPKIIDSVHDDANLPTEEDDLTRNELMKEIVRRASPVLGNKERAEDTPFIGETTSDVNAKTSDITFPPMGVPSCSGVNPDELSDRSDDVDMDAAFRTILEETVLPDLPEVLRTQKCSQNFPDVKAIKFPDKTDAPEPKESSGEVLVNVPGVEAAFKPKETNTEVATKLTNPKKRFVKCFEDSELLNEQSKSKIEEKSGPVVEIRAEEKPKEQFGSNTLEVSKLKTQLMSKLKETPPPKSARNEFSKTTRRSFTLDQIDSEISFKQLNSPKSEESPSKRKKSGSVENNKKPDDIQVPKENIGIELITDGIPSEKKQVSAKIRETKNQICKKTEAGVDNRFRTQQHAEQVNICSRAVEMGAGEIDIDGDVVNMDVQGEGVKFPEGSEEVKIQGESVTISEGSEKMVDTNEDVQFSHLSVQNDRQSENVKRSELVDAANEHDKIETKSVLTEDCMEGAGPSKTEDTEMESVTDASPAKIEDAKTESDEIVQYNVDIPATVPENEEICRSAVENVEVREPDVASDIGENDAEGSDLNERNTHDAAISASKTYLEPELEKIPAETSMGGGEIEGTTVDSTVNGDEEINSIETKESSTLSALATLAEVSERSVDLDAHCERPDKEPDVLDLAVTSENEVAAADISSASPKPITLSSFSMDFSDSNHSDVMNDNEKIGAADPKIESPGRDSLKFKGKIVEYSPDCDVEERIPPSIVCGKAVSVESEMAMLTHTNPDVEAMEEEEASINTSSTKLLEILTDAKPKCGVSKAKSKFDVKNSKFTIKPAITHAIKLGKPIILSEKIIKPTAESETVSVQKVTCKRSYQDVEDIDTFIIQKPAKKIAITSDPEPFENDTVKAKQPTRKSRGKAKILQQTIITPAGHIIQPGVSGAQPDDAMFDIDSMPIVLSDQILTAESIENMPVVLSESFQSSANKSPAKKPHVQQMKLLNKTAVIIKENSPNAIKTYATQKLNKKAYQPTNSKVGKNSPTIITQTGKPGKYYIVPSGTSPGSSKYMVGKRPIVKKSTPAILPNTSAMTKVQNIAPEPSGNKIMIVTNQQGQQSRVLLTPAQQKMLGYQSPGQKVVKSPAKGTILAPAKSAGILSHAIVNSKGQIITASSPNLISRDGQLLTPLTQQQIKSLKAEIPKGKKLQVQGQKVIVQNSVKVSPGAAQKKTIIFKNQQGQTVKKIQGTDDALLEQEVAEQVQAIKASANYVSDARESVPRRVASKKPFITEATKQRIAGRTQILLNSSVNNSAQKSEVSLPPLAPISPTKKADVPVKSEQAEEVQQKPLQQLVIQDALGNQTTITEGQILALPSETVDGQPQSYMLVTLDESGNLTPLNNEALLSLDPNLGLGGDLSNMVLQIDQGASSGSTKQSGGAAKAFQKLIPETSVPQSSSALELAPEQKEVTPEVSEEKAPDGAASQLLDANSVQAVSCNINNDPNQQLIITGDPVSTQKLLESLTEGNTDLANLLASAEGSSILIHTDGQQIIINTDSENQLLLPVNPDVMENTEGGGNPIFATQPPKNQDILAAALADTDVFQQDHSAAVSKISQSQLSPNNALYPMNVGNVLETSLTLSSPIMTPLEVPSTNSKKIPDDETEDILCQVPKNVDLPITITDPNISHTVSQHQLLANNLDLPLTITDPTVVTPRDMNSPSYVYSLPALDDAVDLHPKPFSGSISMPLLTEEPEEAPIAEPSAETRTEADHTVTPAESMLPEPLGDGSEIAPPKRTFMEEGLCTLGAEMCSSLSEPPPDMFDLSLVNANFAKAAADMRRISIPADTNHNGDECRSNDNNLFNIAAPNSTSNSPKVNVDENSCEIPVQPQIVTSLDAAESDQIVANERGCGDDARESKRSKLD